MVKSINSGNVKTRKIIEVTAVPEGQDWVEFSVNFVAGQQGTITISASPLSELLGIWEFYFSVRVDTNDGDHLFPEGADLNSGQRDLEIYQWEDLATSDDITGKRSHKIRLVNNDSSPHTYYILYKFYTLSAVAGG